ncbi:MAG: hypothetical protein ABW127_18515 [Candidatus Thiodiazotropha endolucinida]
MNSSTRRVFLVVFLLGTDVSSNAAELPIPQIDPLDGLQFQGETGEKGKAKHHNDTIAFDNGKFRSIDCEEWGFEPAPYTYKKVGNSYQFSATLPSSKRGTLTWEGIIKDDKAEASFRWLHKRWYWTIDREYWFKGNLKNTP